VKLAGDWDTVARVISGLRLSCETKKKAAQERAAFFFSAN
jgi:hypothetical protein